MKKAAVLSAFWVLIFVFTVRAKPQSSAPYLNGSFWNRETEAERLSFVMGYDMGKNDVGRLMATSRSPVTPRDGILRRTGAKVPVGPTYGEIRDTMSLFYKDYRNMPVCMSDAENVAFLILTGSAPSETEIVALRTEDAREGCH